MDSDNKAVETKNNKKTRPTLVGVIAIFVILSGIMSLAFSLIFLVSGILTSILIGVVFFIIGVLNIITSIGLFKMTKWGLYLFIILGVIAIIYLIFTNFYPNISLNSTSDISILIYLAIFFYFSRIIKRFE